MLYRILRRYRKRFGYLVRKDIETDVCFVGFYNLNIWKAIVGICEISGLESTLEVSILERRFVCIVVLLNLEYFVLEHMTVI